MQKRSQRSATNKWDKLSDVFNTHRDGDKTNPAAADNVEILWPVILKIIGAKNKKTRILDFGCGCGGFCDELCRKGFDVTGIDTSKQMIKTAKTNTSKKIDYKACDINGLRGKNFDTIISIMVLQFIEDIEACAAKLYDLLSDGGEVVFAVFNPEFIERCLKINRGFVARDKLKIEGVVVKTHTRSEKEYKRIFAGAGFRFIKTYKPKFTKAFVKKFNWTLPSDVSEYMVMTFKK